MIGPEDQAVQTQEAINAIASHAAKLYELMQPGTVVDVLLPSPNDILVPNQPPRKKRLLIVKPLMHIRLDAKPGG